MRFWARINKETLGPFTLKELADHPEIHERTLICPTTSTEWRRAGEFAEEEKRRRESEKLKEVPPPPPPSESETPPGPVPVAAPQGETLISRAAPVVAGALLALAGAFAYQKSIHDPKTAEDEAVKIKILTQREMQVSEKEAELQKEAARIAAEGDALNKEKELLRQDLVLWKEKQVKDKGTAIRQAEKEVKDRWAELLRAKIKTTAAEKKYREERASGTGGPGSPTYNEMAAARIACKHAFDDYNDSVSGFKRSFGDADWDEFSRRGNLIELECSD